MTTASGDTGQASMLTMVGVSHRNAPLAVRERFAIPADRLPEVRHEVADRFDAGAIVATCNRLELYVPGDHPAGELRSFLCDAAAVTPSLGDRYLLPRHDADAVSHLYAVAAGIDSMVLGESEILGQVRGAFSATVAAAADTALLSRLFHTAIRLGRRARSETAIGHGALSISSIAAQQARSLVPDLARASVLVIGAGEAGRLAAAALVDHGVGSITVSNRTASRAEALAEQLRGRSVPYESVGAELAAADVVIAATDAPEPVLNTGRVASALVRREGSPMLIVDIGVPRAADPAVAAVPGVTYRDIDDLQEVAARHARARAAEVATVETMIEEETASFLEWWEQLRIVPTISALTERAEGMRQAELERTLRRLDATPEQRDQLDAMTRALVRRILHDPITTLRERGDRDVYLDAVRRLFRLDEHASPNGDSDGGP